MFIYLWKDAVPAFIEGECNACVEFAQLVWNEFCPRLPSSSSVRSEMFGAFTAYFDGSVVQRVALLSVSCMLVFL